MISPKTLHKRRQRRVRHKLSAKSEGRLRLAVFRSGMHIHAQLIDDAKGHTVAAASTLGKKVRGVEGAKAAGQELAKNALAVGIDPKGVFFDRSGYLFHGRVKALAEGAREGGLLF